MNDSRKPAVNSTVVIENILMLGMLVVLALFLAWRGTDSPVRALEPTPIQVPDACPTPSPGLHLVALNYAIEADSSPRVVANEIKATPTPSPEPDRTKPIYDVYDVKTLIKMPAEWQWYIRDLADEYGFDERIILGCILAESTFQEKLKGDSGSSLGLAQVNGHYWLKKDVLVDYRIKDKWWERNLLDAYDNIDTMIELWRYAVDKYDIDLSTTQGYKDLLYFHNTGKYIHDVDWAYSNKIVRYSTERVILIEEE